MENDVKEEFISTLSHEIRTPLTSIKGFSQTMLNSWEALDDNKKKDFLKIILSQSQRLINLVENVLNVARIDSDNDNIILTKTDIKALLKNCTDVVLINYKNFKFNYTEPKYELYCLIDKNKTQQIFINILDNALKYSNNSDVVDVNLYNKGDFNVLSVKNYGSYIEESEIPHIFEKFYRVDSYIHSTTQGSGLGLYIANNLAKTMQGHIEVTSDKKSLSTEFLVYLPVYEVEKITKCIKQES